MIASNETIKTGLNLALGALFILDDAGVGVVEVEVSAARPIITVDRAPPMIRAACSVTKFVGGVQSTVYIGELRGCRVQWTDALPCKPARSAA